MGVSSHAKLRELVCIGAGTNVAEGTTITRSVVGRGCRIGAGCTIENSYIMANVTVCDSALRGYCHPGAVCIALMRLPARPLEHERVPLLIQQV